MYFSGKITNSILNHLAKNEVDLEPFFEMTEVPAEFLRDPTCWLESHKVESFLRELDQKHFVGKNWLEEAGHSAVDLKSWGVLDSVLRMMMEPRDIYNHPQRFISYFVSPAPPIGGLDYGKEQVCFELPISSEEYPMVTAYLQAALAGLPLFMKKDMAQAVWQKTRVILSWSKAQEDLFTEPPENRQMDPRFVQGLISNLETAEKEIEQLRLELTNKEALIEKLQDEKQGAGIHLSSPSYQKLQEWQAGIEEIEPVLQELQGQFMRLVDYQTRAQQLVTLLSAHVSVSTSAKAAMGRVDWDYIKSEFSKVVDAGVENLKLVRKRLRSYTPQEEKLVNKKEQQNLFSQAPSS